MNETELKFELLMLMLYETRNLKLEQSVRRSLNHYISTHFRSGFLKISNSCKAFWFEKFV